VVHGSTCHDPFREESSTSDQGQHQYTSDLESIGDRDPIGDNYSTMATSEEVPSTSVDDLAL
jgi:hypothetical protein